MKITTFKLALKIWFKTSLLYSLLLSISGLISYKSWVLFFITTPICLIVTIPALLALWLSLHCIYYLKIKNELAWIVFGFNCLIIILVYGVFNTQILTEFFSFITEQDYLYKYLMASGILLICVLTSVLHSLNYLKENFHQSNKKNIMNNSNSSVEVQNEVETTLSNKNDSNKVLIKAIIMAIIAFVLLIPTFFISNLVEEREKRQESVVKEVSNKWANAQTIGTPFIHIPYTEIEKEKGKKDVSITKDLYLLPQNLSVNASLIPEIRKRSIYKVYLYKSQLQANGSFMPSIPSDIPIENIDFSKAKVCFLLNDIKGIDEKLSIEFNGLYYDFTPGLPFKTSIQVLEESEVYDGTDARINAVKTGYKELEGLSVSIPFTKEMLQKNIQFSLSAKINGSESLHFIPIAANSKFSLQSSWQNPKFDGKKVPSERIIKDSGFAATWNFNSANLPFGTALKEFIIHPATYAFGVSMVQPADHYSKTNRCIKYAILFIGLSFALFFIVELMQKNPLHPVQYLLVGVALLVFFTLLLSISEFLFFDFSYAIASFATVLLISFYAKAHFKSIKTAFVFASLIGSLYAFIFVLIRLEDTALLVGSIGLFLVLSIVMYTSRKINWYASSNN